jgi:endonuclease
VPASFACFRTSPEAAAEPLPAGPPGQGPAAPDGSLYGVRLVIARCSVDYVGRLKAHLPLATRLLLVKADGSVLVHSDGGSYKPLNWMSPPATLRVSSPEDVDLETGVVEQWTVQSAKTDDRLIINIHEKLSDSSHDLGVDPGLIKDGVEADLQRLLAEQIETLGEGYSLIRREYFTAIGPVDILARDADGATVAVELKRRGDIDGVEQLTRYLELLNRDPLLAPVRGIFAAQQIKPQAKVLANDRGIDCVTLDYDAMRGVDDVESRLF